MSKKEKCSICGGNGDEVYAIVYYDDGGEYNQWVVNASDGGDYTWTGGLGNCSQNEAEKYIQSFNIKYEFHI